MDSRNSLETNFKLETETDGRAKEIGDQLNREDGETIMDGDKTVLLLKLFLYANFINSDLYLL